MYQYAVALARGRYKYEDRVGLNLSTKVDVFGHTVWDS